MENVTKIEELNKCNKCGRPFFNTGINSDATLCECPITHPGKMENPLFPKEETPSKGMLGWICPVCGRGMSPFSDSCPCTIDYKITCGK